MAGDSSFMSVLKKRPIVGDGSYVVTLEKRGYCQAGPWVPEAVVEYPEAVLGLHREYLRAGADVLQSCTFNFSKGGLRLSSGKTYTCEEVNQAACDLLHQLKAEGHQFFMCGGISETPTFANGGTKEEIMNEFREQLQILVKNKMDFLLGEFIADVEEAELAIAAMKETGLPVACTMRLGPTGDARDVSRGECAVRMARAGADIVGINCQYDPFALIDVLKQMKQALDKAGLTPMLMIQPPGLHCADTNHTKNGLHALPEVPYAKEPRILTRWDVHQITRLAYEAGARYIGGCCGYESYHIMAVSEELAEERGFRAPAQDKVAPWGEHLKLAAYKPFHARTGKAYWSSVVPGTGRPLPVDSIKGKCIE